MACLGGQSSNGWRSLSGSDIRESRGRRGPAARIRIGLAGMLALVCALATAGPWSEEAEAGSRYASDKSRIARGLYLVRKYDNKINARIKVLKVDPSTAMTIDVALSNDELPGREKTTSMAARHDAIAGVNASFGMSWGRPIGVFAEDGALKTSPLVAGGAFSLSRDESVGHIGYPRFTVRAHILQSTNKALWISDWNDQFPHPDKISGWTGAGGSVVKPPDNACSAKLKKTSKVRWARNNQGVSRVYRVRKVRCRERPFTVGGGVVLAAPQGSVGATKPTERANCGDKVNLTWSVGWMGAMDVSTVRKIIQEARRRARSESRWRRIEHDGCEGRGR